MTELNLVLEHLRKSYLRPVLTDVNLQVHLIKHPGIGGGV